MARPVPRVNAVAVVGDGGEVAIVKVAIRHAWRPAGHRLAERASASASAGRMTAHTRPASETDENAARTIAHLRPKPAHPRSLPARHRERKLVPPSPAATHG